MVTTYEEVAQAAPTQTYTSRRLGPDLVRKTVLKYRGRCLHILGRRVNDSWRITGYNPSFAPDIPPGMLNRMKGHRPDEHALVAYNNAGQWDTGDTGLVITDQAVHLAISDWALAPDPPKGRIGRAFKHAPTMNFRIELTDLEEVTGHGGLGGALGIPGIVINQTYHIPMDNVASPWTGFGWTPEQVLKGILIDLMELRLPTSERMPKKEVWLTGGKENQQPIFPQKCVVCLEPPVEVVPVEVPSTQVRVPGYGKQVAWATRVFEPGMPLCKTHKPVWSDKIADGKGHGIEAYCLADYSWQLSGLRDVVKKLKMEKEPAGKAAMSPVAVTAICLKFKNPEYQSLFCEANGVLPG